MSHCDAIIVGAGPAGSVAAVVLARAGWRVAMVDRPDDGRFRIGEALPAAAGRLLRRLGLPTPDGSGMHRVVRGTISSWGGPPTLQDHLGDPEGPSWRLDRRAFDSALRGTARDHGATFVAGWVRRAEHGAGGWRLRTQQGHTLEAATVVDASGRRALLARAAGARRRSDPPLAALWAVGAAGPKTTDRTLIEATATGWWYAARLPGDRAIAVYHTGPRAAARLSKDPPAWRRAHAETRLIAAEMAPELFTGCCLFTSDARGAQLDSVAGEDWIACGDAAISFDPVASQGLFNALATGEKAALALLSDDRTAALSRYGQAIEEIRRVYALRCQAVYARAGASFGTPFWLERVWLEGKSFDHPSVSGALPPSGRLELSF